MRKERPRCDVCGAPCRKLLQVGVDVHVRRTVAPWIRQVCESDARRLETKKR